MICYWIHYVIIVFDMWSTVGKLPVSPILLYSSDLLVITTQDTHLILNTPQVNFRKHKNWNLTHTHIHIQTDIVTTKNGKQLSSHCSKFTYHVPWMFIFIYTFITSYNRSLLPQLFTGEDSATTNTPPHFVAGGAVSVPFVQQAYALYSV